MVTVRCKTQHCQAIGEGETLQEAIDSVDHAVALSRHPNGCIGKPLAKYEIVKKNKLDKYESVKDVTDESSESKPSSSSQTKSKK